MRPLLPHQGQGVDYAMAITHPAFIMAMRTGKTLTSVRWVQKLDYPKRVLVTAPLSVLESWKGELYQESEPWFDLHDVPRKRRDDELTDVWGTRHRMWTLVNFELLRVLSEVAFVPWDVVLVDESVVISNPSAKITKLMTKGFRSAKHRAILTGLPSPESPLQLFTQMQFLDGKFMGCNSYWSWRARYFQPDTWGHQYVPKKGVRTLIKSSLHERAFIRRKQDVGMHNRKVFEHRYVDMNAEQKRIYRSICKDFAYQKLDGTWNETQWAMTTQLWLQRLAGGFDPEGQRCLSTAKATEVVRLLMGDLKGEQVVIWFKFRAEVEMVSEFLRGYGISNEWITSQVPPAEREVKRQAFQSKKIRCLLATEKSVKRGKDFSAGDTALYYSNEWSCDDRLQSEERIEHPLKKATLLYVDMVTRGSMDQELVARIRDKGFNAKELMVKHLIEMGGLR